MDLEYTPLERRLRSPGDQDLQRPSTGETLPAVYSGDEGLVPLPACDALCQMAEAWLVRARRRRFFRPKLDDLAEYFRRHRTLAGLDDVLVDVIKPDEVRTHAVPEYERYREASFPLAIPRKGPGAAIVVVEGGALRAMTLLLVSDITVVTKEWQGGALAFGFGHRSGHVRLLRSAMVPKPRFPSAANGRVAVHLHPYWLSRKCW